MAWPDPVRRLMAELIDAELKLRATADAREHQRQYVRARPDRQTQGREPEQGPSGTVCGRTAGGTLPAIMTMDAAHPPSARPIEFHPRRNEACPVLMAIVSGQLAHLDGRTRRSDLDRLDVRLVCRSRPGVVLAPDYVLDICLGRAYPYNSCLFGASETARH